MEILKPLSQRTLRGISRVNLLGGRKNGQGGTPTTYLRTYRREMYLINSEKGV